jgi:hypothetical protein
MVRLGRDLAIDSCSGSGSDSGVGSASSRSSISDSDLDSALDSDWEVLFLSDAPGVSSSSLMASSSVASFASGRVVLSLMMMHSRHLMGPPLLNMTS